MCRACQEHRAPNTPAEVRCEARRTGTTTEALHAAEAAAAYGKPPANPYERQAREKKAAAIAMTLSAMTDGMTEEKIAKLRACPDEFRAAAAFHARQQAPSAKTWERVVELLEGEVMKAREREERENDAEWLRAEIKKLEEARREWRYGSRRQGLRAGEVIHELLTRYRKRLVELDPFDGTREEDTPAPPARRSA